MDFIPAKTIISGYSGDNKWFGNNYNMNIYKGCSHGCIYCDSRSECYHVENFDNVRAKENALTLIHRDLKSKRKTGVIGTGAMSDPYNPIEKEYELTRGALKLINSFGFGISIATKSNLVTRDIDILNKIRQHSPTLIKLTITTCDDVLCKKIEPNVAVSSQRFSALKQLAENKIFAGILLMPVLPFIEDNAENISGIIRLASENGAKFIYPAFGVTLRQNQRDWYYRKLDEIFPHLKEKYARQYGNSYECHSPSSNELWQLMKSECERLGMLYKMDDIIRAYKKGYCNDQLRLF
ncbi:SPL family radical SAM protein [Desulfosporosinus meridiei]|uniref:DNA repair photolyase n=1 Tax=Desulfosporosinus meridiei (strain ATCC BAA-275 / DSM 13257 / KCTC 12902 / NCIMB 13706 / S10) TaxID=768704 RepID=J7IYV9_DESMD|nr:radical SAM protein [Desulfosporosinus meridiei]AFQ45299.1 DNA repair photolyase [Desulfosporosinus meridiei DSM 13257]